MSDRPALWYAGIIKNKELVAETCHQSIKQNTFSTIGIQLYSKVVAPHTSRSEYEQYAFFIMRNSGAMFMLITDKEYQERLGFKVIVDLMDIYYNDFKTSKNVQDLKQKMEEKMYFYNQEGCDSIQESYKIIEQLKEQLIENMKKMEERAQLIERLLRGTEVLVHLSTQLKKNARELKRAMWMRNNKMYLYMVLGVSIAAYLALVYFTGSFTLGLA